jgi:D-alanyl-D-alanine carboxypeptidase
MIAKMLNLDLSQVKGAKTGFTDTAGLCFASLIRVEDHDMIMITLGAPPILKEGYHIRDAYTLINYKGSKEIREVQKIMNKATYKYFDICPCDGISQRK